MILQKIANFANKPDIVEWTLFRNENAVNLHTGTNPIKQGFSNFFGWPPPYLFLEILRPSRCKISHKRPFIWELFGKID